MHAGFTIKQNRGNFIGRKDFLIRTGLLLGAGAFASLGLTPSVVQKFRSKYLLDSWEDIKAQFNLSPDYIQMAHFFLTSHPKPVRDAIEMHRDGFDKNPVGYFFENVDKAEAAMLKAASDYFDVNPEDIALTDSTTMGLGLIYSSIDVGPDQEILTTTHDHYSTDTSLKLRAERTGAKVRKISLYKDGVQITEDEIISNLIKNITSQTRVIAVTWVHSCTGVKLPIANMSSALKNVNKNRDEKDRILFCVDGVHGLGVENTTLKEMDCDFFMSGTHKWIFGPRGTGLVYGKPEAWKFAHATIPTFNHAAYEIWMKVKEPEEIPYGAVMSPGGFHSFEHRWAVDKAFLLHQTIGKQKVQDRVHFLNTKLKEGLKRMSKVKIITPMDENLSSGITCFEIDGQDPFKAVEKLWSKGIACSVTPYATQYVRLSPSLVTLEDEVERTLAEVAKLA
jgi:selenocysteine lyase/cysteine desulfurase